jgi:hypothetical protein
MKSQSPTFRSPARRRAEAQFAELHPAGPRPGRAQKSRAPSSPGPDETSALQEVVRKGLRGFSRPVPRPLVSP